MSVAEIRVSSGECGIKCLKSFEAGVLALRADERILAVPKLTFGYGLVGNLIFALLVGASSILLEDPYHVESFLLAVERHQPTMVLVQPRVVAQIIDLKPPQMKLASTRVWLSAGEALSPTLSDEWNKRYQIPLLDVVGSTELGHIFIGNKFGSSRPGTAGRVLPGFEVRIVDDRGFDVRPGQRGELLARGDSMTKLYWGDPKRTSDLAGSCWIRTGDIFSCSLDGYYSMLGRVDDLIKVGCGEWIDPIEIEDILNQDEQVAESAVVGQMNADGLTEVHAFVVVNSSDVQEEALIDRLQKAVRRRWPDEPHKHVTEIRFIEQLPRSINGKITRAVLRSYSSGSPSPCASVSIADSGQNPNTSVSPGQAQRPYEP